ncbi:DUF2807 domain-containing protein [Myxococcaceae bacterium GXIMD 01537]
MRASFVAVVGVVALAACGDGSGGEPSGPAVMGNGEKRQESRRPGSFRRVENRTPLRVVVREQDEAVVDVTLDANLQGLLRTRVEGDLLLIDSKAPLSFTGAGLVEVHAPRFTSAKQLSSGALVFEGVTRAEDVELYVGGSGSLDFYGPARMLTATVDGSGRLSARTPPEWVTNVVNLSMGGSGSLDYEGRALQVNAESDSSGTLTAMGAAGRLVANASGSGDIRAQALQAIEADLTVESSGDVLAKATGGPVTVSIEGSGNVELWGSPPLSVNNSGSGRFIQH